MLHQFIRKTLFKCRQFVLPAKATGKEAQHIIANLLQSPSPCMIGRFGSSEIQAVINGKLPFPLNQIMKKRIWNNILTCSGFFPVNKNSIKEFTELMIKCMEQCDCLASWRLEEVFFLKHLKQAKRISLDMLGPVNENCDYTWYKYLENKHILVISPFAELIEYQYNTNRTHIWKNPEILPKYASLQTIKSVNSLGGISDFKSWFDALYYMEDEINKKDFDIAILGCGAYGFPLAAYIKSIGKKAIHIGGATQLIYGIKGKRWEGASFINKYWISPRPQDRPKGYEKVEGGCYW